MDPFNAFCHFAPSAARPALRVGIKDNIAVKGMPLTCGSAYLKDHVSDYNATLVEHLSSDATFSIVGKTNMDEFAMGSNSDRSCHGPVRHALFPGYSPGGSSGGSAAAVAAGLADVAIGTDTGGSVRLPASYHGLVGFKPSYGAISRHGVIPYAPSLDHVGIIGHNVAEIRSLFSVLTKPCALDATYRPVDKSQSLTAVFGTFESDNPQVDVKQRFQIPMADQLAGIYYITAMCEAASCLAKFVDSAAFAPHSRRHLLGDEVKRRITIGSALLTQSGDAYLKAQRYRMVLREMLHWIFQAVDILVVQTAGPPPKIGVKEVRLGAELKQDAFLRLANLTGIPAITIPLHPTSSVDNFQGTMLMAPIGKDYLLLNAAEKMLKEYRK